MRHGEEEEGRGRGGGRRERHGEEGCQGMSS